MILYFHISVDLCFIKIVCDHSKLKAGGEKRLGYMKRQFSQLCGGAPQGAPANSKGCPGAL
jgi:hypothetical protein